MISAGAHIPLMQDATTATLLVGMILGTSVAMWVISRGAGWLAVAASSFILIYMISGT